MRYLYSETWGITIWYHHFGKCVGSGRTRWLSLCTLLTVTSGLDALQFACTDNGVAFRALHGAGRIVTPKGHLIETHVIETPVVHLVKMVSKLITDSTLQYGL